MTSQEFWDDSYRARNVIEDAAGATVRGYRAPNFSINDSVPWAYPILEELGFQYDSSVFPVRHGFYGNHQAPRFPYLVGPDLFELPVATWRTFNQNLPVGGGAYLRILPFGLMNNGLRALNEKECAPAVLYLHPWELDPSQPRLRASWKSRLRQYTGLDSMKGRLERLLQQFKFATIYDSIYLPAVTHIREASSNERIA
jgi:polysaccharide deacetylase family protein (PEP-CTERM system associated)